MSLDIYLEMVGNVDIALDSFPYNGATTTIDALWMGTPLVALRGDRGIARGSYSIMRTLKIPELVADTPEEWAAIDVRLATDAAWRRALRGSLRNRLASSPLMNSAELVADLESAYRQMWRNWCQAEHRCCSV